MGRPTPRADVLGPSQTPVVFGVAMTLTRSSMLAGARLRAYLQSSWRILLKEVAGFGTVGTLALGLDVAVYNLLAEFGWLKAKAVSATVSTMVAFIGNRHLSFSHRARSGLARETAWFFGINAVILGFSELVLALFAYRLGQGDDPLVMNVVNLGAIAAGGLTRFLAYKRFVFLHPERDAQHVARATSDEPGQSTT